MTTLAQNPAIQAQAQTSSPVLTLANPAHNSSTDLQPACNRCGFYRKLETFPTYKITACNRWGFYPDTRPLGLFKKVPLLPFKMKAGIASKVETFPRFISMLTTVKMRRNILLTLDCAKPVGAFDRVILSVIQAEHPNTTKEQLRRELEYLAGRDLIKAEQRQDGRWFCQLVGVAL
jgi:hypothetical protein